MQAVDILLLSKKRKEKPKLLLKSNKLKTSTNGEKKNKTKIMSKISLNSKGSNTQIFIYLEAEKKAYN